MVQQIYKGYSQNKIRTAVKYMSNCMIAYCPNDDGATIQMAVKKL
jgi:hypothetical protein